MTATSEKLWSFEGPYMWVHVVRGQDWMCLYACCLCVNFRLFGDPCVFRHAYQLRVNSDFPCAASEEYLFCFCVSLCTILCCVFLHESSKVSKILLRIFIEFLIPAHTRLAWGEKTCKQARNSQISPLTVRYWLQVTLGLAECKPPRAISSPEAVV